MTPGRERFAGFGPAAFSFFNELRDNNDPAWFKPRKSIYEAEILAPFRELIAAVETALREAGLPLVGDPKSSIFRIYRDVRFSPDKRLYKTHAGAVLTRSGRKGDPGVLYLHLAPGESMVAAGFWHPEPALLNRLRRAMLQDPDRFLAMAGRLAAEGHPIASDERLSRLPRGFESAKGTSVAEYIAFKSFTAHKSLSDSQMQSPALVDCIIDFAGTVLPLLEWGWAAVDHTEAIAPVIRAPRRPLPKPDF
ncbi:MAG: TIGR02453 family protein [Stellaceae bacterium]